MSERHYPLDLELWKAACAERATRAEIDAWIFYLVDVLCEAGFNARVFREGFGRVLLVDDLRKPIDGISGQLELEGLFDFLADLGIRTEIYPGLSLYALHLGEPAATVETSGSDALNRLIEQKVGQKLKEGKGLASFRGESKPLPTSHPSTGA